MAVTSLVLLLLISAAPSSDYPRRAVADPSLAELFTYEDYPPRALHRNIEGTVRFRLEVDANGAVANCEIVGTSGNSDLDQRTCEVLRQRARFRPALDERGRRAPDTVVHQAQWRIEAPPHFSFSAWHRMAALKVVAGRPVCEETVNGDFIGPMPAYECRLMIAPMMELLERLGSGAELTLVESFTPAGEAQAVPTADYGERLWEEDARLVISTDGSVGCELLTSGGSGLWRPPAGDEVCGFFADKSERFEPSRDPVRRTGIWHLGLYLTRRPSTP